MGFITPNTFLVVENGVLLRRFLFEENRIIELYETFNVFPDAVVEPINIILKKIPSQVSDEFRVLTEGRKKGEANFQIFSHGLVFKRENLIFNYRETKQQRILYLKLSLITPLSNYAETKAGIKPYEKGKGNPPQSDEVLKLKPFNSFEYLGESWFKLIRGTQINRYHISWDGEYLKYGEWLAAPRNPTTFLNPKIVIRRTDDKLLCSFDDNNLLGLNSIHCLQCFNNEVNIKYLLALLNSKLINWFFRHENFHMVGKPLAEVKVVFVERLPILKIAFESQKKFIDRVNQMLSLYLKLDNKKSSFTKYIQSQIKAETVRSKLQNWNGLEFGDFIDEINKTIKTSGGEKLSKIQEMEWMDVFENQKAEAQTIKVEIDKIDREIDQMVYGLYGLTEEEIRIVEGISN